jgi:hypothetical protein
MFKLNPERCKFVERVIIFFNTAMNTDIGVLLSHFPALRDVCVPTALVTRKQIKRGAYKYMERYLEHLTEYNGSAMITSLLEYNTYYRLKSLTTYEHTRFSVQELFNKLKNTPVLTELRIGKCNISIADMDILHETAPLLQSLYINDANIDTDNARSLQSSSSVVLNFKPVISMTTFSFSFHRENNRPRDVVDFFRVIRKRYTNLKKFEFNYIDESRENRGDEKLTLYKDILQPFIQELGSSLKELSAFAIHDTQDLYKKLGEAKCQVQNLNIEVSSCDLELRAPGFSSQMEYIRKLTLRNLYCSEFNWFGHYTVLKELHISFASIQNAESGLQNVDLNSFVESIPNTVKAITLAHLQPQFDKATTQLSSVKELELREVPLSHGLDAFISNTFPQLEILRLIQCGLPLNEFITFEHHLRYLHVEDIRTKRNKPKASMLIRTTDDNKERVYRQMKYRMGEDRLTHYLSKLDGTIYPQSKIIPYKSVEADSLIIITCRSVKHVIY